MLDYVWLKEPIKHLFGNRKPNSTKIVVEHHSFEVQRQYVQILNATRMNLDKFDLLAYLEKFRTFMRKKKLIDLESNMREKL